MSADRILTFVVGTSGGLVPSAGLPVRLYTTGGASPIAQVIRCTGGEDGKAVGICQRGALTAGIPVAVAVSEGFRFQATVATTVAQGDRLKIKNGSQFTSAAAIATNTVHYCAKVLKARTNTGLTWLEYIPNGVV